MVRCYIIATELGMDPVETRLAGEGMNWKNLVGDSIIQLFGHHKDQGNYDWCDLEFPKENLPRVWYKRNTVSIDETPGWVGPFTEFV